MQNIVLNKMQAQKGPQTENDAKRIEKTVATIANTPQAFEFLLDAAIATEERAIEQKRFYEDWKDNTGSLKGASRAWEDHKKRTPLIGKNPSSNKPVFFNQFRELMRQSNPEITDEDILTIWRSKYGRSF